MKCWFPVGITAVAASSAVSIVLVAQQPIPTFRSDTGIVVVPVWVKDGDVPVQGLAASDFAVLDDGVPQQIDSVTMASQPVDVTLMLDTSSSLDAESLRTLRAGVEAIGKMLTSSDRVRLITFATRVSRVFDYQPGGTLPMIGDLPAAGTTALYDALGAALSSVSTSERPHLVFCVSDGLDTASFLKANDVVSLSASSGASLFITVVRATTAKAVASSTSRQVLWAVERLREAAAQTGGLVFENPPSTALPTLFAQALSEFRTSYLLSFTPRDVRQGGWHKLLVTTKNPRLTVRARNGYQRQQ